MSPHFRSRLRLFGTTTAVLLLGGSVVHAQQGSYGQFPLWSGAPGYGAPAYGGYANGGYAAGAYPYSAYPNSGYLYSANPYRTTPATPAAPYPQAPYTPYPNSPPPWVYPTAQNLGDRTYDPGDAASGRKGLGSAGDPQQADPGLPPSYAMSAPNMFGTNFGRGLIPMVLPRPAIVVPAVPAIPGTAGTGQSLEGSVTFAPASGTNFTVSGPASNQLTNAGPLTYTQSGGSKTFTATGPSTFTASNAPLGGATAPASASLSAASGNVSSGVQSLYPGLITQYQTGQATAVASPFVTNYNNLSATYNIYTPATAGTLGTPAVPSYLIPRSSILFAVPSFASGGVVGATRISDGNNPMPRDRLIFDYDYFDDAQLTSNGTNVHRFSPGFEKTLFTDRASIEVRVPFAATIDRDISDDGYNTTSRIELGDVNMTLKTLLYKSDVFNFSAGAGVAVPTASSLFVSMVDGTPLVHIHDNSLVVTPFVACLFTPNDHLFVQNWVEYGIDTTGDQVDANPNFTGLQHVGTLKDQSLLQVDAQLGYWLYRTTDESIVMRGLAPFLELHYTTTTDHSRSITAGNFVIGDPNLHYSEFDISAGVTALVGDHMSVSVGAVIPLNQLHRSFDWEVGLRCSWNFGESSQQRKQTPVAANN